jgi:hypothetical protein
MHHLRLLQLVQESLQLQEWTLIRLTRMCLPPVPDVHMSDVPSWNYTSTHNQPLTRSSASKLDSKAGDTSPASTACSNTSLYT